MNRAELGRAIYAVANVRGDFTLRSGQHATEYFDKFLFEADPVLLKAIAEQMTALLPERYDQLAGLEMGGIPIATALSLETRMPVLFVRKERKTYGTCKLAEGAGVDGSRLVIIEDVVTTGGAIIDAVTELRVMGASVHDVCCVIDREGSGRENLERLELRFSPLFTKSELEKLALGEPKER
jgi:orotate phosphoribosyltransferase